MPSSIQSSSIQEAPALFPELIPEPEAPRPLTPEQADKLPHIHRLLLKHYGQPPARELWDPLTQLIYSLLSSRTKTPTSHQVMRDLERRFNAGPGHWEAVRDATVTEIEHAISIVTFPEQKAPHLKLTLQGITERYGSLTLDFLARYRTDKIRSWLEQFPGVGPKTSGAVVNFSTLRRRALCVDSHHLRVAQRLCIVPRADAETTERRLMRLVPETWDAAMLDEHHSLIKLHAQTLCTFAEPKCEACPLLNICPTGKRNVGKLQLTSPIND